MCAWLNAQEPQIKERCKEKGEHIGEFYELNMKLPFQTI